MTTAQMAFLVSWPLLSLIAIGLVYRTKKYNSKERFMFSVVFIIVPILASFLFILIKFKKTIFFWSNPATQDKTMIAAMDVRGSSEDGSGGE